MALLDNLQFNPLLYGGANGNLLDMIKTMGATNDAYKPAPFGLSGPADTDRLPDSAQPTSGQNTIAVGDYQMPRIGFGSPMDAMAKMPEPQAAPTAPPAPQAPGGDFGDRLLAGFQGFANSKGLLPAIANGISGFQNGNQTEAFLMKKGLDAQTARTIASNPTLLRGVLPQLFKPQVRVLSDQEKTTLGLPASAPWFVGADGKPFLPEQLSSLMPKHGAVGVDQFGNQVYGEYDPTKPAGSRVTPDRPLPVAASGPSEIPEPPPGVNPKVWRDEQSKRRTAESLPADTKTVSALRQEIQGLPSYKNFAQAVPVYRSMVDAVGRDNRASDVNLIYGMAKIMDPGSVVRESEMSVAQAIATIPQRLQAEVKSQIEATGRLSPDVRQALIEEARSRIDAYKSSFDQDANLYRGIAERGRMDTRDVLPDFGELPTWQAPGAVTKPKTGTYIWQPNQGLVPAK